MSEFLRGCGFALMMGGGVMILVNVILSPAYVASLKLGEALARTSRIYLVRIAAALIASLLLLFGCIGLFLHQQSASGAFGTVAFLVAFVGTTLLFAMEWSNLFVLRAVARTSPEALTPLDKSQLMSLCAGSSAGLFMLGWLLLTASTALAKVLPQWAALTAGIGLLLIPILGATRLGVYGQIVGHGLFGLGLVGLGFGVLSAA